MKRFKNYLGDINHLLDTSSDGKNGDYVHPALKNLGSLSIVVLREAVAPVVFRNAEQEITDIEVGEEPHVRAVPNKFKYPERGRGLQILRAYKAGGKQPQNKTVLRKGDKPSDGFDINALVFGDSANQDNRVLPVKAAVGYSDGLSLRPKYACVDETFHNRAMEDGTLFDAESKKNSDNLFTRHFIKPGTLMVQVLSTRGKCLPLEALDHLLLSMGMAGAYGGQTSVTGTNIRTRIVGAYASKFERASTSPYEIVKKLQGKDEETLSDAEAVSGLIHETLQKDHETSMDAAEAGNYLNSLVDRFEKNDESLADQYAGTAAKTAELFDSWFGTGK